MARVAPPVSRDDRPLARSAAFVTRPVAVSALLAPSPRVGIRSGVDVGGSSARLALVLAAICLATLLALAYVTQTLGTRAYQYEADTLKHEQLGLLQTLQSQGGPIANAASQRVIEAWAAKNQLSALGTKLTIKAR